MFSLFALFRHFDAVQGASSRENSVFGCYMANAAEKTGSMKNRLAYDYSKLYFTQIYASKISNFEPKSVSLRFY